MSAFCTQFKLLSSKNVTSLGRHKCRTFCEILPAFIFAGLVMVLLRGQTRETLSSDKNLKYWNHLVYPPTVFDSESGQNGTYTMSLDAHLEAKEFLEELVKFTGYNREGESEYSPFMDFAGPFFWLKPACAANDTRSYNSSVIAYVKSDSLVQSDLIQQVEAQISNFQGIADLIHDVIYNGTAQEVIEMSGMSLLEGTNQRPHPDYPFPMPYSLGKDLIYFMRNDQPWQFKEFDSKEALDDYISDPDYGYKRDRPGVCFGFHVKEEAANKYEVEVFYNDMPNYGYAYYQAFPYQGEIYQDPEYNWLPGIPDFARLVLYGPQYIQNWAANAILKRSTGLDDARFVAYQGVASGFEFSQDEYILIVWIWLPFAVVVMSLPAIYVTTYDVVEEKKTGARDMLEQKGLNKASYWLSWLLIYSIKVFVSSLIAWALLLFTGEVQHSSIGLLLLLYVVYGISCFWAVLVAQTAFDTPLEAARTSVLMITSLYLLLEPQTMNAVAPKWQRVLSMLISPQYSLSHAIKMFGFSEFTNLGFTTETWTWKWRQTSGLICFFMIIFTSAVYSTLALIKDAHNRRNNLFKKKTVEMSSIEPSDSHELGYSGREYLSGKKAQISDDEDTTTQADMTICGDFSMSVFKGQIVTLLGHHGSGKTAILRHLAQIQETPSMNLKIMLHQDPKANMKISYNFDAYFKELSVEQHLTLSMEFSGVENDREARQNIKYVTEHLLLPPNKLFTHLNSIERRKLGVAMALLSGDRVVVLDEPTRDFDPLQKKSLLRLIGTFKNKKIIVLATNKIEDLYTLAEQGISIQIGLILNGKVKVQQSLEKLGRKLCAGYHFYMALEQADQDESFIKPIKMMLIEKLGNKLQIIHQTKNESVHGLVVFIPDKYTPKLNEFLNDLDVRKEQLHIKSYQLKRANKQEAFVWFNDQTLLKDQFDQTLKSFSMTNSPRGVMDNSLLARQDKYKSNEAQVDWEQLRASSRFSHDKDDSEQLPAIREASLPVSAVHTRGISVDNEPGKSPYKSMPPITTVKPVFHAENVIAAKKEADQEVGDMEFSEEKARAAASLPNLQTEQADDHEFEEEDGAARGDQWKRPFSVSLNESDVNCCGQCCMVFTTRFKILGRQKRRLIIDLFLSVGLVLLAIMITQIRVVKRSPSLIISPDVYPYEYKILVGDYPVSDSDLSVEDIIETTPGEDEIKWLYTNRPEDAQYNYTELFGYTKELSDEIWPYKQQFSTVDIFKTDLESHQYQFININNMTQPMMAFVTPQLMYESLLKQANQDDDFEFKLRSTPFPHTNEYFQRTLSYSSLHLWFVLALAYVIVFTQIIGRVTTERLSGARSYQRVQGQGTMSWYLANFCYDLVRLEILIIVTIIFMTLIPKAGGMGYKRTWIFFPLAMIPFIYVCSRCFRKVSSATYCMSRFGMVSLYFIPSVIFFIRYNSVLSAIITLMAGLDPQYPASNMVQLARLLPPVPMASAFYFEAYGTGRLEWQGDSPPYADLYDPDNFSNTAGDFVMVLLHTIVWWLTLTVVEGCGVKCCQRNRSQRQKKKINFPEQEMDDFLQQQIQESLAKTGSLKISGVSKWVKTRKVLERSDYCGFCCFEKKVVKRGWQVKLNEFSLGIAYGQSTAFIGGPNSGIDDLFKIIMGEEMPDQGLVQVFGIEKDGQFDAYRRHLGYCSSRDLFFQDLTVLENLQYFFKLRGIPNSEVQDITQLIKMFELNRDMRAGVLSKFNSRKLSMAIACLGAPHFILVDQINDGLSAEETQQVYQLLAQMQRYGSLIVYSRDFFHSDVFKPSTYCLMGEGGEIHALGTSEALMKQHGDAAYLAEVNIEKPKKFEIDQVIKEYLYLSGKKLKSGEVMINCEEAFALLQKLDVDEMVIDELKGNALFQGINCYQKNLAIHLHKEKSLMAIITEIAKVFTSVELLKKSETLIKLRILSADIDHDLAFVLGFFASVRSDGRLSHYSASQFTLEQIFDNLQKQNSKKVYQQKNGRLQRIV